MPELDGVRGLAIAMVIAFHLVQAMPVISQALPRHVITVSRLGQTGVDLFFVLSGYLITSILLRQRGCTGALKNFWGRRFLRIFPLYYVVLTLAWIVPQIRTLPVDVAASDAWLWSYLANIPPTISHQETSLPHFWSLAVEEQFYLFWPLLALMVTPRIVGRVSLALFVLAPIARWYSVTIGWSAFYALPCRMDALAAGAWLATCTKERSLNVEMLRRIRWLVPIGLVGAGAWF
ncbi:MAG: acyltransferase [Planctomycetaceae bacterium]|nr:acyltransferase [Planctomycetaceae bacterium]